jgi:hypothetical protein
VGRGDPLHPWAKKREIMPQFAVMHIEKSSGNTTGIGRHIDRTRMPKNADPARKHLNRDFIPHLDKLNDDVKKRIKAGYTGKKAIRKDAVKAVRFILGGSKDRMYEIEADPKLFNAWIFENRKFMEDRFGNENLIRLNLHMDEGTPHLHAVIVPLTADGRLSAKEMLGGPKGMQQLQEDYAQKMAYFGLERGIKGSKAKHTDVQEYYASLNDPLRATDVKQAIENIPERGLLENREKYQDKVIKHITPYVSRIFSELSLMRGEMAMNGLLDPITLQRYKRGYVVQKTPEKTAKKRPNLNDKQKRKGMGRKNNQGPKMGFI